MRLFEVLLIVVNILLTGWMIFARKKTQRNLLTLFGISAILMLIHGLAEGMRLPMIPAYALTALPLLLFVIRLKAKHGQAEEQAVKKRSAVKLVLLTLLTVIYSAV